MASKKIYVDLDLQNASKVTNLAPGTAAGDAVNKQQLDDAVQGTAWKDEAIVATQANINLASPGATIDGVTMSAGMRVLVKAQTTGSQNGIYVWNGAATAMTRAADADTAADLRQATVSVAQGTDASTTWRQTATVTTLGTDTVTFANFGTAAPTASETVAGISELASQGEVDGNTGGARVVTSDTLNAWSGRVQKHEETFGDGSATQYDISHNFGTRDVTVAVYEVGSPYGEVFAGIEHLDTNTVRITVNTAPASNSLRAVVRS